MNKTQLTCFFLNVNLDQAGTETQTANIVICILNSVFSLVTCTGNSIILYVIWKTQELHSPFFILLSVNQSINHLFSNAGLQSGSHKADVDLQRTNEI